MYRFIIIDDEPWAALGLSEVIDWNGLQFELAAIETDPSRAYDLIKQVQPDVVFTDIRMDKMSGLELIAQLKRGGVDALFVLISAHADFQAAQSAFKLGVEGYILKPFDPEDVGDIARRLIRLLSRKRKRLVFPLEPGPFYQSDACVSFLRELMIHQNMFAAVCGGLELLQLEQDGLVCAPISAEGGVTAYLCSTVYEQRDAVLAFQRLVARESGEVGFSRVRKIDFDALPDALTEGLYALRCGFQYSANPQTAAVQAYLCRYMAEPLRVSDIAERFNFSGAYLCTLFKRQTGMTLVHFHQRVRMRWALWLTLNTDDKLRDIALSVGYDDYSYFGRLFRRSTGGASPETLRRNAARRG
ncbi:MAG: response regulator [Oscillospiraceae bacterium]|jgi:two-component system response regulator YesN|nr:response regulator [Oscillospiraceae bacterium]